MIIRIFNEGQYKVSDDAVAQLNSIDDRIESAVEADDAPAFRAALEELHDAVAAHGSHIDDDFIGESDLVLPDRDATIEEVKSLMGEEGLIPD